RIQTSYLQLVMTRLWEEESKEWDQGVKSVRELRLQTLKKLGNADEILQTHLANVMGALTAREQEIASLVFPHLVTAFGTKIAAPISGLVRLTGVKQE